MTWDDLIVPTQLTNSPCPQNQAPPNAILPPCLDSEGQSEPDRLQHEPTVDIHLNSALRQLARGAIPAAVHGALLRQEERMAGPTRHLLHPLPVKRSDLSIKMGKWLRHAVELAGGTSAGLILSRNEHMNIMY